MKKMEENLIISNVLIENYNTICNSVFDYMISFESDDAKTQQNFTLKRDHIQRVIGYTEVLARSLECEEETILIAQLAGLLHDIGRFEQFEEYLTFNDNVSVDHAELGVQIIEKNEWLKELPEEIQLTIKQVVFIHNKISIPKNSSEQVVLIAKIIRDSDKIDILDQAIKEYSLQNKQKNSSFTLDLENSSSISKSIIKSINAEKLPDKRDMVSTTDFKLVQLAYVYDINFKMSFSIINRKDYLKKLFETLPKSDPVFDLYRRTKIFVENQLI